MKRLGGMLWISPEMVQIRRRCLHLCVCRPQAEEEQTCPVPQEEEEEVRVLTLPLQAHHAMEKMEEFVYKVQPKAEKGRGRGAGLPGLSLTGKLTWG